MTQNEAARDSHKRTCNGKYSYPSRRAARKGARKTPDGHNLVPYRCSYCGRYHNGHTLATRRTKP